MELVMDYINDPGYMNILKTNFIQAPNQYMGGYTYVGPPQDLSNYQEIMDTANTIHNKMTRYSIQ